MNHTARLNLVSRLQPIATGINIIGLTKNINTQCQALNMAFFMSAIQGFFIRAGMKDRIQNTLEQVSKMDTCLFLRFSRKSNSGVVSKYGRVNARIQDPFGGNKCRSVDASSDYLAACFAGELTKNINGGQPMPLNTSHAPTVGQFAFNINLPANSFIKRFSAVRFLDYWQIVIDTESGQIATIKDPSTSRAMKFQTLDHLADWLGSQGVPEMNVFLPQGAQVPAGNASTMGGAE